MEDMEERLKADVLLEAVQFGNRILVAHENDEMQVVEVWEPVTEADVQTPLEVYEELMGERQGWKSQAKCVAVMLPTMIEEMQGMMSRVMQQTGSATSRGCEYAVERIQSGSREFMAHVMPAIPVATAGQRLPDPIYHQHISTLSRCAHPARS